MLYRQAYMRNNQCRCSTSQLHFTQKLFKNIVVTSHLCKSLRQAVLQAKHIISQLSGNKNNMLLIFFSYIRNSNVRSVLFCDHDSNYFCTIFMMIYLFSIIYHYYTVFEILHYLFLLRHNRNRPHSLDILTCLTSRQLLFVSPGVKASQRAIRRPRVIQHVTVRMLQGGSRSQCFGLVYHNSVYLAAIDNSCMAFYLRLYSIYTYQYLNSRMAHYHPFFVYESVH